MFFVNKPYDMVKYLLYLDIDGKYFAEMWSSRTVRWLPAPQKLANILALIAFPLALNASHNRHIRLPKPWH